jgi:phosphoserine phosphatase RsbU/P
VSTATAGKSFPFNAEAQRPHGAIPRATRFARRSGISYRASLVLSLSVLVVATGLSVSLLSFRGARTGTDQLAHSLFQEVSDHAVTRTRGFLERALPIAQMLKDVAHLGLGLDDHDLLARQLAAILRANPGVSWISYSDQSGAFVGAYHTTAGELRVNRSYIDESGRTPVVEHDVLPDGSWRLFRNEADSGFDPRVRPFYVAAKEAGRLVWPPPYVFYDQGVPGVTCANPLYDAAGGLRGVITVDFDLDMLSQFVSQLSVSPNSRMFMMSTDGTLLAYPGRQVAARGARPGARGQGELLKVDELGDPLIAAFDAQLGPQDRVVGDEGVDRPRQFNFHHEGTAYYARSTAFTIGGDLVWIVGVMAPQADFLAGAHRTSAISAGASVLAMLLAVVVAMVLARRVSGPVLALVSFMDGVRNGDLTGRARLGGAREFRQLSEALNRMLHDLRDGTRLRDAMAVAMQVQQGLLPARAPALEGLDVYGFSAYCDETGGDYFDYLPFDRSGSAADDRDRPCGQRTHRRGLLVAIGDVVGHGIGSAIVMAGARGVLHSRAKGCGDIGELMSHLNEQLVEDMASGRFVTMLLWYIDPQDGTTFWANAGHDPAMVYDPQTDAFTQSASGGNIPLGIEGGIRYEEHPFDPVRPGQVIVLGTDGIWETQNYTGERYGKPRLMNAVRAAASGSASEIADAVRRDLDRFRGREHQRDDVTLVVIKVLPRGDAGAEAALAGSPAAV